jgi:hypothetical protein
MRVLAALAVTAVLAACAGGTEPPSARLASIAGPANAAALQAASACNNDDALALARGAAQDAPADERLFSQFIQASLLREMGDTDAAEAAIDTAAQDPAMNPEGRSRAEIAQGEAAVSQMIAQQRIATTGSAGCGDA